MIKWIKSLFIKKQCAKSYRHESGGYVYCIRNSGHLGNCKSYIGEIITRNVCCQCHQEIEDNDDAGVCTSCGGFNIPKVD